MSSIQSVSRTTYVLWVLGLSLLLTSPTFAAAACEAAVQYQRAGAHDDGLTFPVFVHAYRIRE